MENGTEPGEGGTDPAENPAPCDPAREDVSGIVWLPWLIIVAATVILVYGAMWSARLNEKYRPPADSDRLTILRLQAKSMIGAQELAALQGGKSTELPTGQLRGFLPNPDPATLAAVAVLENFLRHDSDEQGRQEILAAVDRDIESFSGENAELLSAVRAAIAEPQSLTAENWQTLEQRLGWFGKLLAACEGGPDRDKAAAIRTAGKSFAMLWSMGAVLFLAVGGTGCVLLFFAIWQCSHKELPLRLQPASPGAARILLECFAVYLGAMAVSDLLTMDSMKAAFPPYEKGYLNLPPEIMLFVSLLLPVAAAIGWAWFRRRSGTGGKEHTRGLRRAAGLHLGRGFFREVGCGLLGYVAILPVVALGIAATAVLTLVVADMAGDGGAAPTPIAHPIVSEIAKGDWRILLAMFALASVAAPLFEESLFRGAFHGGMRGRRYTFWISALINSLIFAAIHPQGLMAVPALAAMGFGFSMLREWRGSLIAPMTAHAFHNGTVVLVLWIVLAG